MRLATKIRRNNMISKSLALKVLNEALATGGDYAEIYLEENDSQSVMLENGKVETSGTRRSYGAGIRILNQLKSVYGYTSVLSAKSLTTLAHDLAASFTGTRKIEVKNIEKQRVKNTNPIVDHLTDVPVADKVALLKECYAITSSVDKRLVRIQDMFANNLKTIEIYSAEAEIGKQFENTEERGRLVMVAAAVDNGKIETNFQGPGRYAGWHFFKDVLDWKKLARECGEKAILFLDAKECPSGRFPVVITNGWGGVIFHEACGHSLEATATAKHLSVFSDSIGKQIANPIVSAFDDGTMPNEWGSNNIDSEGHVTQKNQLIKDGICVGFLVDKFNGRRLNMGRRVSLQEHLEIMTNKATSGKKTIYVFSKRITLRKPYFTINKNNISINSFLSYLSFAPLDEVKQNYSLLANYIRSNQLSANDVMKMATLFPAKTSTKLLATDLYRSLWKH